MNFERFNKLHGLWRFCSYLMDIHLEDCSSKYNPNLQLYLSCGEFKLLSDHAIYSYGLKYIHFVQAFKELDFRRYDLQHILVLGLGMGSIPEILQKKFECKAWFDLVELDAEVIFLFEKYQDYILEDRHKCYCMDGFDYVRNCNKKYDLICMDIFEDDCVPKQYESESFLQSITHLLADGGWFLYNRLNVSTADRIANERFNKSFSHQMPGSKILATDYNKIFAFQKIKG